MTKSVLLLSSKDHGRDERKRGRSPGDGGNGTFKAVTPYRKHQILLNLIRKLEEVGENSEESRRNWEKMKLGETG